MTKKNDCLAAEPIWCQQCLTGFKCGYLCPQCSYVFDEAQDPRQLQLAQGILGSRLRALLPDIENFVEQMKDDPLKEILTKIISRDLSELITQDEKCILGPLAYSVNIYAVSQPTESIRTVMFSLSGLLEKETRQEFLSRPQIASLNFEQTVPVEERFVETRYVPLAPLVFAEQDEGVGKIILYLATREALSQSDWQHHFQKSLRLALVDENAVASEAARWRQLLSKGERPERPLTAWLMHLSHNGYDANVSNDLIVYAGAASSSLGLKQYEAAEEIARAALRLIAEIDEAGALSVDTVEREALLLSLRSTIASCSSLADEDSSGYEDRRELMKSSFGMAQDLIPEEVRSEVNSIMESVFPLADIGMQLQFADQCFREGQLEQAEVKYNRIILACLNTDDESSGGTDDVSEHSEALKLASLLVPSVFAMNSFSLVKASIRLAELKIKRRETENALNLLERAEHYAGDVMKKFNACASDLWCDPQVPHRVPSTPSFEPFRHKLDHELDTFKAVIYGNLAMLYRASGERSRALHMAKEAKKRLRMIKPAELMGYEMNHAEMSSLCNELL
jgi:tetratricopeptide (TPR) repeat protein